MLKRTLLLMLTVSVIPLITSNGKFYVGFLGYKNKNNLNMDGECCDGVADGSGHCGVTCDLLFQVSVYGLDGGNMTNKRPSRRPINDTNSFMFSDEYKNAVNPITFDFKKWPGKVQLVVQVFDQDRVKDSANMTLEAVDEMDYTVSLDQASSHFIYQNITGIRSISPSVIMLLFRYECGPTYYGSDCLTDCLMYPNNPLCPRTTIPTFSTTPPTEMTSQPSEPATPLTDCTTTATTATTTTTTTSTTTATTTSTTTPTTDHTDYTTTPEPDSTDYTTTSTSDARTTSLSSTEETILSTSSLPSTDTSTTVATSTTDAFSSTSYSQSSERPGVSSTSTEPSTDSGITSTVDFTKTNSSSTSESTSPNSNNSSISTFSQPLNNYSGSSTSQTYTLITSDPPGVSDRTTIRSSSKPNEQSTTPDTAPISTKDPKDFALTGQSNDDWAIILGCVLGGLMIFTIVVFLVYQNRQKRIRKRQEIYNVSPEVISIVEENGATERSDVPITTSPL